MLFPRHFDVIVVGGGHAGTEAALAAARMCASTLLLTHSIETLGQMSCNPSIGGIGKGHLVKEIDALGGAMALAADEAGIHFRILNGSKGPAVRATRAQADRVLYRAAIRRRIENQPNLLVFQAACDDLIVQGDRVTGVVTQVGVRFSAASVVLTAGTFLDGRIHVGLQNHPGGRAGDPPARTLSSRLKELKLPQGRLKTGTPPRLDGRTIDYSKLVEQPGDGAGNGDVNGSVGPADVPVFSFLGDPSQHPRQISCWITQTNARTHEIIRSGFSRSPMFTGRIDGVGPRYCPSIEDKVNRFGDKSSHQVFLEPEGLNTHEVYPNGISTSLPFDVQLEAVRSIAGLEQAHILRPGYAIEYDYFDPRALKPSFETRAIAGLFFAGQINGTTGYEEAAGQGLVAGSNAAARALAGAPLVLGRESSYIGVLIDDLVTRGVDEPYRLFTSRSEFRLTVRQDNALRRLAPIGLPLGIYGDAERAVIARRLEAEDEARRLAESTSIRPEQADAALSAARSTSLVHSARIAEVARRQDVSLHELFRAVGVGGDLPRDAVVSTELELKYAGYFERERSQADKLRRMGAFSLDASLPYEEMRSLSFEARQKLGALRPRTLAHAASVPGVSPTDLQNLVIEIEKRRSRQLT